MGCLYGVEAGIDLSSYAFCFRVYMMLMSVVRLDIDDDFILWVSDG